MDGKTRHRENQDKAASYLWSQSFSLLMGGIYTILLLCICAFVFLLLKDHVDFPFGKKIPTVKTKQRKVNKDKVINGIHLETGLVFDDNFELVRATCTACHSAKIITQNRATRVGWKQLIIWMQKTQGLWALGKQEPRILDYLSKHYAPEAVGRRANIDLSEVEWFILDLE